MVRFGIALLLAAVSAPLLAAEPFPEWPESAWRPLYDRAVQHVVTRRLLTGYPDCTYKPARIATRYEWGAVLSRLVWYFDLDLTEREYLPPDVPWNHWCADELHLLTAAGLYPTPPGTPFNGNRPLTRGDFAVMCRDLMTAMEGRKPPARLSDMGVPQARAAQDLIDRHMLVKFADGKLHLEKFVPRWQICVTVHRIVLWNEERGGTHRMDPGDRPPLRRGAPR